MPECHFLHATSARPCCQVKLCTTGAATSSPISLNVCVRHSRRQIERPGAGKCCAHVCVRARVCAAMCHGVAYRRGSGMQHYVQKQAEI